MASDAAAGPFGGGAGHGAIGAQGAVLGGSSCAGDGSASMVVVVGELSGDEQLRVAVEDVERGILMVALQSCSFGIAVSSAWYLPGNSTKHFEAELKDNDVQKLTIVVRRIAKKKKRHHAGMSVIAWGVRGWEVNARTRSLDQQLKTFVSRHSARFSADIQGQKILHHKSDDLETVVLINPSEETACAEVRALVAGPCRHKLLVLAGCCYEDSGDLCLRDGFFTPDSLADIIFSEPEVTEPLGSPLPPDRPRLTLHCPRRGGWHSLASPALEHLQQELLEVRVNPEPLLPPTEGLLEFTEYLSESLEVQGPFELLEPPTSGGFLKLTRPCCYIFPGGRGDSALFAVNGFNILLDGGSHPSSGLWKLVRHLDRVDSMLITHAGADNLPSVNSLLQRKVAEGDEEASQGSTSPSEWMKNLISPEIGVVFFNAPDVAPRAARSPPSRAAVDEARLTVQLLEKLGIKPEPLVRPPGRDLLEPVTLFHKMGVGRLDMYVLNPVGDGDELRRFVNDWGRGDQRDQRGPGAAASLDRATSISALVVWHPVAPCERTVRVLFSGSAPQAKILEGLDRLRHLDFLRRPVVTEKDVAEKDEAAAAAAVAAESQSSGEGATPAGGPRAGAGDRSPGHASGDRGDGAGSSRAEPAEAAAGTSEAASATVAPSEAAVPENRQEKREAVSVDGKKAPTILKKTARDSQEKLKRADSLSQKEKEAKQLKKEVVKRDKDVKKELKRDDSKKAERKVKVDKKELKKEEVKREVRREVRRESSVSSKKDEEPKKTARPSEGRVKRELKEVKKDVGKTTKKTPEKPLKRESSLRDTASGATKTADKSKAAKGDKKKEAKADNPPRVAAESTPDAAPPPPPALATLQTKMEQQLERSRMSTPEDLTRDFDDLKQEERGDEEPGLEIVDKADVPAEDEVLGDRSPDTPLSKEDVVPSSGEEPRFRTALSTESPDEGIAATDGEAELESSPPEESSGEIEAGRGDGKRAAANGERRGRAVAEEQRARREEEEADDAFAESSDTGEYEEKAETEDNDEREFKDGAGDQPGRRADEASRRPDAGDWERAAAATVTGDAAGSVPPGAQRDSGSRTDSDGAADQADAESSDEEPERRGDGSDDNDDDPLLCDSSKHDGQLMDIDEEAFFEQGKALSNLTNEAPSPPPRQPPVDHPSTYLEMESLSSVGIQTLGRRAPGDGYSASKLHAEPANPPASERERLDSESSSTVTRTEETQGKDQVISARTISPTSSIEEDRSFQLPPAKFRLANVSAKGGDDDGEDGGQQFRRGSAGNGSPQKSPVPPSPLLKTPGSERSVNFDLTPTEIRTTLDRNILNFEQKLNNSLKDRIIGESTAFRADFQPVSPTASAGHTPFYQSPVEEELRVMQVELADAADPPGDATSDKEKNVSPMDEPVPDFVYSDEKVLSPMRSPPPLGCAYRPPSQRSSASDEDSPGAKDPDSSAGSEAAAPKLDLKEFESLTSEGGASKSKRSLSFDKIPPSLGVAADFPSLSPFEEARPPLGSGPPAPADGDPPPARASGWKHEGALSQLRSSSERSLSPVEENIVGPGYIQFEAPSPESQGPRRPSKADVVVIPGDGAETRAPAGKELPYFAVEKSRDRAERATATSRRGDERPGGREAPAVAVPNGPTEVDFSPPAEAAGRRLPSDAKAEREAARREPAFDLSLRGTGEPAAGADDGERGGHGAPRDSGATSPGASFTGGYPIVELVETPGADPDEEPESGRWPLIESVTSPTGPLAGSPPASPIVEEAASPELSRSSSVRSSCTVEGPSVVEVPAGRPCRGDGASPGQDNEEDSTGHGSRSGDDDDDDNGGRGSLGDEAAPLATAAGVDLCLVSPCEFKHARAPFSAGDDGRDRNQRGDRQRDRGDEQETSAGDDNGDGVSASKRGPARGTGAPPPPPPPPPPAFRHHHHHHHHRDDDTPPSSVSESLPTQTDSDVPPETEECPSITADAMLDSDDDSECLPTDKPAPPATAAAPTPGLRQPAATAGLAAALADPRPPGRDPGLAMVDPEAAVVPQDGPLKREPREKAAKGRKATAAPSSPGRRSHAKAKAAGAPGKEEEREKKMKRKEDVEKDAAKSPNGKTRARGDGRPAATGAGRSTPRGAAPLPVHVDLAFVPGHAAPGSCDAEFFRRVRASHYVVSGAHPAAGQPCRAVLDALLRGKASWPGGDAAQVTVVPTHDTEVLRQWFHETRDQQRLLGVSVLAANSTVLMQGEAFPACKVEF